MMAADARARAAAAVARIRSTAPAIVDLDGVRLGEALEQQLFFALRDGRLGRGRLHAAGSLTGGAARHGAALAASLRPRRHRLPRRPLVAVLVRETVHLEVVDRVASDLAALGGPSVISLLTGRAATIPTRGGHPALPLTHLLRFASLVPLVAWDARLAVATPRIRHAVRAGEPGLDGADLAAAALDVLPRIALAAAALDGAVRLLRPVLLAAFDEVGTWGRILPSVAARHRIGSLDIPHAEAADAVAIRGAGYSRMAVYGPHAAAVLRGAGIAPDRIVEVGAPRFDPLASTRSVVRPATHPPVVVFAAQYPAGAFTEAVQAAAFRGALAAAAAVAPAELVVRPHPAQPSTLLDPLLRVTPAPEGVTIRVETERPLHERLDGAWLLVTAWSNSVFEAALAGVPALTVVPVGVEDPVGFAAEGLALGAVDEVGAADAARLLLDGDERRRAVDRARDALPGRIGQADGRASERLARLILEMIDAGGCLE